ncbi:hypothetical protein BB561_000411 [Smittium simulii]|uniref:MYND-type domain-containing protein n=1 Tax=Smittium simulii TaxID=133385 RepID=A0A2T9YZA7_9FUNG|nr:hypothetical protein BB561_000411 [Smittium simulii]
MRESNFNFPITNKACVSISSALYDRRALDCTAVLPLVNSLWNLGYLTLSSARIREIMTTDGGLERLVRILRSSRISKDPKDTHKTWKWLMAYHCVINIGVRGTEPVRKHVVQTGAISIIVDILEAYLKKMEVVDMGKQINQIKNITNATSLVAKGAYNFNNVGNGSLNQQFDSSSINREGFFNSSNSNLNNNNMRSENAPTQYDPFYNNRNNSNTSISQEHSQTGPAYGSIYNNLNSSENAGISVNRNSNQAVEDEIQMSLEDQRPITELNLSSISTLSARSQVTSSSLSNRPYEHNRLEVLQMQYEQAQRDLQKIDNVMFRPEDVALALQLLAYVSKYSEVRQALHCVTINSPNSSSTETINNKRYVNVFSLVQKFTFRNNLQYMQGWAGIIMTNMCRKDDKMGGIRKCANVNCQKWETPSLPFAKCRRCRKAKYCSRECQSIAWASGHKNWCSERVGSYDINDNTIEAAQQPAIPRDNPNATQLIFLNNTQSNTSGAVRRNPRSNNLNQYSPYPASRNQNVNVNSLLNNGMINSNENNNRSTSIPNFNNITRPISGSHQISQLAFSSNSSNLSHINTTQNSNNIARNVPLQLGSTSRNNNINEISNIQSGPRQQVFMQNAQPETLSFRNYNHEHFNSNASSSINLNNNNNSIQNVVLSENNPQPEMYSISNENSNNFINTNPYRNNFGSNF